MTVPPRLLSEIVDSPAHLGTAIKAMLGSREIGLDTESNGRHRYPEQLCLIQIATAQKIYLVDTIRLREISPLKSVLENASILKVIQSADNDIRSLDRHCGLRVSNVFDTMVAARFCGLEQSGLGSLIEGILGITISKSKSMQTSDWGRRPLPRAAIDYAASDVRHLCDLKNALSQRLEELGRAQWVAEECARLEEVRYVAPSRESAYLSVKGANDLDSRGLAILKSLFSFREKEALHLRRPPFFVVPDQALITLALLAGLRS